MGDNMKLTIKPYKSMFLGIVTVGLFSGLGMVFYIGTLRGIFVSIIEICMIKIFGILPGLIIGRIIAVSWSHTILAGYIERYKRARAQREVKALSLWSA